MEETSPSYPQYVDQIFVWCINSFLLGTSQFWSDVNKNIDSQINFSELEEYFKVNVTATTEKKDIEAPKKKKEAVKIPKISFLNSHH